MQEGAPAPSCDLSPDRHAIDTGPAKKRPLLPSSRRVRSRPIPRLDSPRPDKTSGGVSRQSGGAGMKISRTLRVGAVAVVLAVVVVGASQARGNDHHGNNNKKIPKTFV